MAAKKEGNMFRQDDTRQDTSRKANTEVHFTDTGGQNRHDTRRDHPAKG